MQKNYNVFNDGIYQLINDLELLKRDLIDMNGEIAMELGSVAYDSVMLNAHKAQEQDQRDDIRSLTQKNILKVGEEALVAISNPSYKVTFAEFGYGIVGKGYPYRGEEMFSMASAGWQGYDIDSPRKSDKDRSWRYRDRSGQVHKSQGEIPTHIFFYSGQTVIQQYETVTRKWLERILGESLK